MQTAINNIISFLTLNWLTGPIFDKELRVSSRRKRNYFVRFAYLAILLTAVVFIWIDEVSYYSSAVYQASRMARAGMSITMVIVWFQFIAAQVVAVIMLSTAISDEIYHKTLATLMTTPITSFQIVMGKLLSKLLQILLLIAISFPLLSIVRVFGGIPWDCVVSGFCLTMSTVILVGSLSLFYSIFTRKAYVSIILTLLTLFMVYLVFPAMIALLALLSRSFEAKEYFGFFGHTNPYFSMTMNAARLDNPANIPAFYSWHLSCSLILAFATVLIAFSVKQVRKVARRQATGQLDTVRRPDPVRRIGDSFETTAQPYNARIRPVKFSPVLWKEMRSPLLGKGKVKVLYIVGIIISLIPILIIYAVAGSHDIFKEREFHVFMTTVYFSIGVLFTVVLPATCITSEKESRSWHLLLTTTLSDWQIVFGKAIGSFRRFAPAWCYLFAHIILFTLCGFIHPLGLIQMIIIVTGACALLTGTGIYCSALFKRTTTAVIMNIIVVPLLWIVALLPLMPIFFMAGIYGDWLDWFPGDLYYYSIPFVQAVDSMEMTANGIDHLRRSNWSGDNFSAMTSTMFMLFFAMLNIAIGLLFTWRAKKRFRKKIF